MAKRIVALSVLAYFFHAPGNTGDQAIIDQLLHSANIAVDEDDMVVALENSVIEAVPESSYFPTRGTAKDVNGKHEGQALATSARPTSK
jgi:hypothetical protein